MLELVMTIVVVLIASGICSGTEAALFSVPLVRARVLAENGGRAAQALLEICEDMARPIAAVVILNNISNIPGSILVGSVAASVFEDKWLGVFTAGFTLLVILFSEIIPKTLGEQHSERISLVTALPIWWLTRFFTPIIKLFEVVTSPFTRHSAIQTINKVEIELMARIGQKEGVIKRREAEIVQHAFDLARYTAGDVMTPRTEMSCLEGQQTLAEARDEILNSQHSRLVVIDGSRDNVTGLAYRYDMLAAMVNGAADKPIAELQRKARFVPKAQPALRLLDDFQKTRQHIAVVVDEYGGVSGVVTLEDVLEVLTGEIVDETDRTVDMQAAARKRGQQLSD